MLPSLLIPDLLPQPNNSVTVTTYSKRTAPAALSVCICRLLLSNTGLPMLLFHPDNMLTLERGDRIQAVCGSRTHMVDISLSLCRVAVYSCHDGPIMCSCVNDRVPQFRTVFFRLSTGALSLLSFSLLASILEA